MLDVWDEMMTLEGRIDDLFRPLLGARVRPAPPEAVPGFRRPFLPATDVYAKDGRLVVKLELPGLDPATDISVTLVEGDLVVRGERKRTDEVKDEAYYRMETSYGMFERRIPLPGGVAPKDIEAEYKEGILEIQVPVAPKVLEEAKPTTIPIKSIGTKKAA
jgi:HSP20 family protein